MKKIEQRIVNKKTGDCTKSCLASILEMDYDEVPNFIEKGADWFKGFWEFLTEHGCQYLGTGWIKGPDRPHGHVLSESPNIGGYVIASVPSRTFEDVGHSVVMDLHGMVVHDPNPNKLWDKINVVESDDLKHWMMISQL